MNIRSCIQKKEHIKINQLRRLPRLLFLFYALRFKSVLTDVVTTLDGNHGGNGYIRTSLILKCYHPSPLTYYTDWWQYSYFYKPRHCNIPNNNNKLNLFRVIENKKKWTDICNCLCDTPVAHSSTFTATIATMFEIRSAISQVEGIWNLIVTWKRHHISFKLKH